MARRPRHGQHAVCRVGLGRFVHASQAAEVEGLVGEPRDDRPHLGDLVSGGAVGDLARPVGARAPPGVAGGVDAPVALLGVLVGGCLCAFALLAQLVQGGATGFLHQSRLRRGIRGNCIGDGRGLLGGHVTPAGSGAEAGLGCQAPAHPQSEQGLAVLEFVLLVPVFVLMVFVVAGLGRLGLAREHIDAAARDVDALKLARNSRRRAEQEQDPGADLPPRPSPSTAAFCSRSTRSPLATSSPGSGPELRALPRAAPVQLHG